MNKKYLSAFFAFFLFAMSVNAQVGIGLPVPDPSAMLDIYSTNKGLLVPRVSLTGTVDNTTITKPQISLLVYNTGTAGSGSKAIVPGYYYWDGSAWEALAVTGSLSSSTWGLKGNAGTDPAANFIGTTDNQPLVFKINNELAGKIASANWNTSFGIRSLAKNTTGGNNTAIGVEALSFNSAGSNNTANGVRALYYNTTGVYNTAAGVCALNYNTSGSFNTANGESALFSNTTGSHNTAIGISALYMNTSGIYNTAIGELALFKNMGGNYNVALGYGTLLSNTAGSNNIAIGDSALFSNSTGNFNSAFGRYALASNTIGTSNTATGGNALYLNTIGYSNSASGRDALYNNTIGNYNTANGERALFYNTTGSNNTALGYGADVVSKNLSNATAIGAGAIVDASNKVRIGNTSVTKIEGQVLLTTPSDGRVKFNIREDVHGLDFIMKLRPLTYQFDTKKLEEQMTGKPINGNGALEASYLEATALRHTGFIAQEVEKAAMETGYHFTGLNKPFSDKDHYSLSYESFIMPLVKAVQEQQEEMNRMAKENEDLKENTISGRTERNELKESIIKMQAAFAIQLELMAQQLKKLQEAATTQGTIEQP